MAFLFSKNYFYHLHDVNGFLVLLHFLYRLFLFAQFKNAFHGANVYTACCILMHGLLHINSFQFSLPSNRVMSRPLIWREFRLHNMIFAYRHIITTLLNLYAPQWWTTYGGNIIVVVAANEAASYVTLHYGSTTKRTTNSMAYPKETDSTDILATKYFYTASQFSATVLSLYGSPDLNFICLLAIQGAAFLMTLGRKGIIRTITYHRLYTAALFVPHLVFAYNVPGFLHNDPMRGCLHIVTMWSSMYIRMYFRWRASLHWVLMVVLSQVFVRCLFYKLWMFDSAVTTMVYISFYINILHCMHNLRWMVR